LTIYSQPMFSSWQKNHQFFFNFWVNIHKLGFQRGEKMDFSPKFDYGKLCHIGFGTSLQDLSSLKWCPHIVTSPNIALLVDHISSSSTFTLIDFHRFMPFDLSHLPNQSYLCKVPFNTHSPTCRRRLPNLNLISNMYVYIVTCEFVRLKHWVSFKSFGGGSKTLSI